MNASTFQTAISPACRAAAWGSTGMGRHDEHVRARLMADDNCVLDQLHAAFAHNAMRFEAAEELAAARAAYLANPTDEAFDRLQYATDNRAMIG